MACKNRHVNYRSLYRMMNLGLLPKQNLNIIKEANVKYVWNQNAHGILTNL
ncbi:hypothetical protein Bca4012_010323 [Brassica carinata]